MDIQLENIIFYLWIKNGKKSSHKIGGIISSMRLKAIFYFYLIPGIITNFILNQNKI